MKQKHPKTAGKITLCSLLARIGTEMLGFLNASFSLAVFFRPFYTPPPKVPNSRDW